MRFENFRTSRKVARIVERITHIPLPDPSVHTWFFWEEPAESELQYLARVQGLPTEGISPPVSPGLFSASPLTPTVQPSHVPHPAGISLMSGLLSGLLYLTCFRNAVLFQNPPQSRPVCFCLSKAAPAACGGSQAWGQIGAAAASLHHRHSNATSKPHLQPTPQLSAMLDP